MQAFPMPRVLLKARPTPSQMADRLAEPVPDGVELYLAAEDVTGDDWLDRLDRVWSTLDLPPDFTVIVEGPLRGLDCAFFDITANSSANQELIRRLISAARLLGAVAINVHAIAPTGAFPADYSAANQSARERALPLLRFLADECTSHGIVPLVENMPPVARMREQSWTYTPLGMSVEDMRWLCGQVSGLGVTLDLSHAGLYISAVIRATPSENAELDPLVLALRGTREGGILLEQRDATFRLSWVADTLGDLVNNVHISNAQGLLGEGMPYGVGDYDLDVAIRRLATTARWMVTETLESDPGTAILMRDAQAHIRRVLAGDPGRSSPAGSREP
jgi:sugar phosphate isomerase/epimerase